MRAGGVIGLLFASLGGAADFAPEFERLFREAAARLEAQLGSDNPRTADAWRDLGLLLLEHGKPAEGETFVRRALTTRQGSPGDPLVLARDREALAAILLAQGDGDGAEPLYRQALSARIEAQGDKHPETAELRVRLAMLLEDKGETAEAEKLYQASVDAAPDADVMERLSGLAEARGDPAAAESWLRRALALREKLLGPVHPKTAAARNGLGLLAMNAGKLDEAGALFEGAIQAYRSGPGLEREDAAFALDNLGNVRRAQERFDESQRLFEQALEIRRATLGGEHPDTATTLVNLGGLFHVQGKLDQAEPLYRQALAIQEKQLGPNDPVVGQTLFNLGHLLAAKEDRSGAIEAFQRAAAILEQTYGPGDEMVVEIRGLLGMLAPR